MIVVSSRFDVWLASLGKLEVVIQACVGCFAGYDVGVSWSSGRDNEGRLLLTARPLKAGLGKAGQGH